MLLQLRRLFRRLSTPVATSVPRCTPALEHLEDRALPSISALPADTGAPASMMCNCAMCLGYSTVSPGQTPSVDAYVFSNGGTSTLGAARWPQPGGLGTQVTLTYSFASSVTNGLNGLSYAALRAAVQEAMAEWAQYAPLRWIEVVDSGPDFTSDNAAGYNSTGYPTIRIGAAYQDGQYGVLGYAYYPSTNGLGGDVVLDSGDVWGNVPGAGVIDLTEVITHELGHALGLGHENTTTAIMNPTYGRRYSGPGTAFLYQDDINGIRALYGTGVGAVVPIGSGGGTSVPGGTPTFTISGSTLTVTGSDGDDSFTFLAGATQHTITANGVSRTYNNSTITRVVFAGGVGYDNLTVYGTTDSQAVALDAGGLTMTGTRINLTATGFDATTVNGGGGNDSLTLTDTIGNDQLVLSSGQVTFQGSGLTWELNGFNTVTANAQQGGYDSVFFVGSAGNDTFTARPGTATLTGLGYALSASGYELAQARNGNGGGDVAYLFDSAGNDVYSYSNGLASLQAGGYSLQTYLFGTTYAYSRAGGFDAATLYGTSNPDSFIATPYAASMSTYLGMAYAVGFESVVGFGNGGSDVTGLYGSSGDDNIYDATGFTSVQAAGVTFQAYGFTGTYILGLDGNDTASIHDSAGNDTFIQADVNGSLLRADGTFTHLYTIERATVYSSAGTDSATLYGSTANDTFYTQGIYGTIANNNAAWTLAGFEVMNLLQSGGFDVVSALTGPSYQLARSGTWVG